MEPGSHGKNWIAGRMENWSNGVMGYWGVSAYGSNGVLAYSSNQVSAHYSSTPLAHRRVICLLGILLFFSFCLPSLAQAEEVLVAHPALTFGDIPYYLAREKGFYREEGFQVKDIDSAEKPLVHPSTNSGRTERWLITLTIFRSC